MIDDKVKKIHGASRGSIPYPCGHCYHFIPETPIYTDGRMKMVIAFGNEEMPDGSRITPYCNGGKQCPDSGLDCSSFAFNERDVRPHCIDAIYDMLERDYTLSILSKIYEYRDIGLPKSKVVDRGTKGYHTRNKRIAELKDMRLIDSFMNDGIEYVRLTQMGNQTAMAVRNLYRNVMTIMQEGDILDDDRARDLFSTISLAPGIASQSITKYANSKDIRIDDILQNLEDAGYVCSQYDENDRNTLRFYTTNLGESVFNRGINNV